MRQHTAYSPVSKLTMRQPTTLAAYSMGKKVVLCGGPGAGGVTKLCNNLSLAISMIGTRCE